MASGWDATDRQDSMSHHPRPQPIGLINGSLSRAAFLAVAAACQRAAEGDTAVLELIPVTIPELLRQLRGTVIPEPRRDKTHRDAWALWRRRHQYRAQQAHQRWHAYADEAPQAG